MDGRPAGRRDDSTLRDDPYVYRGDPTEDLQRLIDKGWIPLLTIMQNPLNCSDVRTCVSTVGSSISDAVHMLDALMVCLLDQRDAIVSGRTREVQ
jgi:hypothetical protein